MQNRTSVSWVVLFVKLALLSIVATVLSFILFTLANFSDHEANLIFSVKTEDAEMTNKELVNLHYFYELSRKWKVQSLADKYLFRDAPFYEIADSYLIKDWQKVRDGLKEKLDDPRAYPYGNAKFRQAQSQYRAGQKKEALNIVLTDITVDFEKALRNCLDSNTPYIKCYDRVWNYDIATNKKDAEEALMVPVPIVKHILGPPKDPDGQIPVLPPNKMPGNSKEGGEKPGGGPWKRP